MVLYGDTQNMTSAAHQGTWTFNPWCIPSHNSFVCGFNVVCHQLAK